MHKLVIGNVYSVVQERRNFFLSSDEEEVILDDLLSYNVSIVPCKPQVNQIIFQQDIENNTSSLLLSDGQNIFACKGESVSHVTGDNNEDQSSKNTDLCLFQKENKEVIVFPSNKCISMTEEGKMLHSRKILLVTTHPEFDHEFDLFYKLPLQWSVSYTLFIDENQDQYHFAGKYHINNDTKHTFLNAEVSLLLGSPPTNQTVKKKFGNKRNKVTKLSMNKKKNTSTQSKEDKVIAFHSQEAMDIFPGMNSIPFVQGFIEPINKHYLVAFDLPLPAQVQVVSDTDQNGFCQVVGQQVIEIQNSSEGGFGIRFPPGDIQILWTNNPDSFEVESFHTSTMALTEESEVIRFNLQPVNTLTASRERTKLTKDDKKFTLTEDITLSVSNKSYHSIVTIVEDTLYRWKNWKITQTSSEFHPNGKDRARWILNLPANATETIHYTVQYSWE